MERLAGESTHEYMLRTMRRPTSDEHVAGAWYGPSAQQVGRNAELETAGSANSSNQSEVTDEEVKRLAEEDGYVIETREAQLTQTILVQPFVHPIQELFTSLLSTRLTDEVRRIANNEDGEYKDATVSFAREIDAWQRTQVMIQGERPHRLTPDASFGHSHGSYPGLVIDISMDGRKDLRKRAQSFILGTCTRVRKVISFDISARSQLATFSIREPSLDLQSEDRRGGYITYAKDLHQVIRDERNCANLDDDIGLRVKLSEMADNMVVRSHGFQDEIIFVSAFDVADLLFQAEGQYNLVLADEMRHDERWSIAEVTAEEEEAQARRHAEERLDGLHPPSSSMAREDQPRIADDAPSDRVNGHFDQQPPRVNGHTEHGHLTNGDAYDWGHRNGVNHDSDVRW